MVLSEHLMNCRACGSLTQVVKEWNYSKNYFHVKLFQCQICFFSFKAYYHNGELSHTIPKTAVVPEKDYKVKRQVLRFLQQNRTVTCDEIAKTLNLNLEEVLSALTRLEKDGLAEKTT
jgi:hypothetical protein